MQNTEQETFNFGWWIIKNCWNIKSILWFGVYPRNPRDVNITNNAKYEWQRVAMWSELNGHYLLNNEHSYCFPTCFFKLITQQRTLFLFSFELSFHPLSFVPAKAQLLTHVLLFFTNPKTSPFTTFIFVRISWHFLSFFILNRTTYTLLNL